MRSSSHKYKVIHASSESPTHKARSMDSQNLDQFWRTSYACENARVDLKFTPVTLHMIQVITSVTPQIEIEAYNLNVMEEEMDNILFIGRTDLISKEGLSDNESLRKKDLRPLDQDLIREKTFTCLRVTLYNPYHKEHPRKLGLSSLIIYGEPADLKKILPDSPPKKKVFGDEYFGKIEGTKDEGSLIVQHGKRNYNQVEKSDQDSRSKGDLVDLFEDYKYAPTKKVKENEQKQRIEHAKTLEIEDDHNNHHRTNERSRGFESFGIDDENEQIQRAIEESKKQYFFDQQIWEDDAQFMEIEKDKIKSPRRGNESPAEIEESQYNQLLDGCAEEPDDISAKSLEEMYNEASKGIEEEDSLTEPLDPMTNEDDYQGWLDDDALQEAFENDRREQERGNAGRGNNDWKATRVVYDKDKSNSNSNANKKYWDHKDHGSSWNQMFKLTGKELSQKYIENELKCRGQLEKSAPIKVTTSAGDVMKGVTFSLGGFPNPLRSTLRNKMCSMGAKFDDELLDGKITHLVCQSKDSGKFKMSKKLKNKIFVVSQEWVDVCATQKKRVDERYYEIK